MPGWTVYLSTDGVRQVPGELTGENGCYTWMDLPPGPSYDVEEDVPADWYAWTPEVVCDPIASGETCSYTFVNSEKGSKSGIKFEDANQNGMLDEGEMGLSGWTIYLLYPDGTAVASTTTDATGYYGFSGLIPGTEYVVCEMLEAGYTQTSPYEGGPLPPDEMLFNCGALNPSYGMWGYTFTPRSGQGFTGNNFGN